MVIEVWYDVIYRGVVSVNVNSLNKGIEVLDYDRFRDWCVLLGMIEWVRSRR